MSRASRTGGGTRGMAFALTLLVVATAVTMAGRPGLSAQQDQWIAYGRDHGGSRYSPLDQLASENVGQLREAWVYRIGELGQGARSRAKLTFEATPIHVGGLLYLSTAFGKVVALDPATGLERWTFDPKVDRSRDYSEVTSRGVSAWRDPAADPQEGCALRIFAGTIDARLIAVDGRTGRPCREFGDEGQLSLARAVGLEGIGDYQVTSPPAIVGDLVIVGSSIGDNWSVDTGSGVVRAFDARTGAERWRWHPVPRTGGVGAANAWTVLSADPARDLVFVPTSSPSPDFFGGLRPGDNRYANSVVALRASTGEIVWHFQTVHHDLWDYDIAAQPVLVTLEREGRVVPALVQATKMGHLFVLHRETGEPLFPIEERPVPASDVPGERAAATQPFPVKPRPLVPQTLAAEDAWGVTPEERAECRALIERHRGGRLFTPPSLEGTIIFPGNAAGTNWGSLAIAPDRQWAVLNATRLATLVELLPRQGFDRARRDPAFEGFELGRQQGAPYGMRRRMVTSSRGIPCNPPPWGTLAAVDLATGDVRWEVPLGTSDMDHPAAAALPDLAGLPNGGGPIVTAGGLVFIAATMDARLRAFDLETGRELWSAPLPRAGIATPMTYMAGGRQYVVIAAGGHGKIDLPTGDYVVAYALQPETAGAGEESFAFRRR